MSARVRYCPVKHEAPAPPTDARASACALSTMTWREALISFERGPAVLRKPLLYPSELRGHGRAALVHRFDLREAALALDGAPLERSATELSVKQSTRRSTVPILSDVRSVPQRSSSPVSTRSTRAARAAGARRGIRR